MRGIVKAIFVFVLSGFASGAAWAIKPERVYVNSPEKMGLVYKDLDVVTSDGVRIKTWFFPVQDTLSEQQMEEAWVRAEKRVYRTDGKKHPTIVICNGDAGNMSYQQLVYARYFVGRGYNVVTFDWRGFGKSGDWEMNRDNLVCTEFLTDYDAVLKQVLKQGEVDAERIAVFGWSTGAYLSMAASAGYEAGKCFVSIGLITTFDQVLPVLRKIPKNKDRPLVVPQDYPEDLQPLRLAPKYDKHTFLIVGQNDDRSPVWMSEKIYRELPGGKELWVVENSGHTIVNEGADKWDLLNGRIREFLDRCLKR